VEVMREQTAVSERRACGLAGIPRTVLHYAPRADRHPALSQRIITLAQDRRRFGYRRIAVLLRREGYHVNDKAVYRRYSQLNLAVGRRKKRRSLALARQPLTAALSPNEVGHSISPATNCQYLSHFISAT